MSLSVEESNGNLIFWENITCPDCGEDAEFDGQFIYCDYCDWAEDDDDEEWDL